MEHETITRRIDFLIDYSINQMETIGKNFSHSLENYLHACERYDSYIYNQFLQYGERNAKYNAYREGEETYLYIASALYNKYLQYCEKKLQSSSSIVLSFSEKKSCMLHVFAVLKRLLGSLNYANNKEYVHYQYTSTDNMAYLPNFGFISVDKTVLKSNGSIIAKNVTLMDILRQWENRDARSEQRKVTYFEGEEKTKKAVEEMESKLLSPYNQLLVDSCLKSVLSRFNPKLINYCYAIEKNSRDFTAQKYVSRWIKKNSDIYINNYRDILDIVTYSQSK